VNRYVLSISLLFAFHCTSAQQYNISTVAGGVAPASSATAAQTSIGDPPRVTVDASGNIYFAGLHSVFKVAPSGTLARIAGNGRSGNSGDGGNATAAELAYPSGIAVDSAGNVYVADISADVVRRISAAGTITTVAGTGTAGFSGDNGPAQAAQLNAPTAVALDGNGNLYIADSGNSAIRKVSGGVITTIAGSGVAGYANDNSDAVNALLNVPQGVATDTAGNVYIADTLNNRIRKIAGNGIITTVAGNGLTSYSGDNVGGTGVVKTSGDGGPATQSSVDFPTGVAVDAAGNLYIADYGNSAIRVVDTKGVINTLIGNQDGVPLEDGQLAASIRLNGPTGVAVDPSGSVYFTEGSIGAGSGHAAGDFKVWRISSSGIFSTAAGNGIESFSGEGGAASAALLNAPAGLAADNAGNIYIADALNNRVRVLAPNGQITTLAGNGIAGFSGDGKPATQAQLNGPRGVAVDNSGQVFVSDTKNNRIRVITGEGLIYTIGGNGNAGFFGDGGRATVASIHAPGAIAADNRGNLYIADTLDHRIRKIDNNNTITTLAGSGTPGYSGDGGPAASAQLNAPAGVAADANGNVYIADTGNNRIRMVSPSGTISTLAGAAKFNAPAALAADNAGNVFIADTADNRVIELLASGTLVTVAGTGTCCYSGDGGPAGAAQLNAPTGMVVDAGGNVYIADTGNNAVRRLQSAPVVPGISAIVNAASNTAGPISPGEIVVIEGAGLGPPQLALSATNTTVTIGGLAAPIIYASNAQLSAVVPFGISGTKAAVSVQYLSQAAAQTSVPVADASPALFTADYSGTGQAVATNQDGSRNSPGNPAPQGSLITLYATGLGQTTPQGVDGVTVTNPLPTPVLPVSVMVGTEHGGVLVAAGVPGAIAGTFQLQVQLPVVVPGAQVPVTMTVGSFTAPTVTIAVAPQ